VTNDNPYGLSMLAMRLAAFLDGNDTLGSSDLVQPLELACKVLRSDLDETRKALQELISHGLACLVSAESLEQEAGRLFVTATPTTPLALGTQLTYVPGQDDQLVAQHLSTGATVTRQHDGLPEGYEIPSARFIRSLRRLIHSGAISADDARVRGIIGIEN